MKIAAAFLLCALLLGVTSAQECTSITEDEIAIVLIREVNMRLSEGVSDVTSVRVNNFNLNCLASGCSVNTYRSLTVTANISYAAPNTGSETQAIFLTDINCIFENNQPRWSGASDAGSEVLNSQKDIEVRLHAPALTNCTECNGLRGDPTFHCVGMGPRLLGIFADNYIHAYIHMLHLKACKQIAKLACWICLHHTAWRMAVV